MRFKRPRSARQRDAQLPPEVDPYRTRYGMSEGMFAVIILAIVFGSLGLLMAVIFLIEQAAG